MPYEFKFPDVGEGITEGEIVKWRVKEGDSVNQDQVLVEVETDKAVVEIPSPKPGSILKIHHKEGDTIKVGETLVTIGDQGETIQEPAQPVQPEPEPEKKEPEPKPAVEEKKESFGVVGEIPETIEDMNSKSKPQPEQPKPVQPEPQQPQNQETLILPAVRRLAKELHVDIDHIKGTGNQGRITEQDVRAATKEQKKEVIAAKVTKKYDMWGYVDRVPVKGIRKATANHMVKAVTNQALVTHMEVCDVTQLWDIRAKEKDKAKASGIHLTFMPFIVKAVVNSLKKHPYLNSSLNQETDEIIIKKYYNIGIAVDMEGGLIVPVIKGADQKSILDLAKEIEAMAEKAKNRKTDLADLKGGTFTITNVGTLGGTFATPIPNYPETAILATGRIHDQPTIIEGRIQPRKILPISLTFDHKVLDGAEAARFTNTIKKYIEDPDFMMMEK